MATANRHQSAAVARAREGRAAGPGGRRYALRAVVLGLVSAAAVTCSGAGGQHAESRVVGSDPSVTPVSGPSWLKHLGVDPRNTQMGRMGGSEPASPTERAEPDLASAATAGQRALHGMMGRFMRSFGTDAQSASRALGESFKLTGADLYRLNCQSCHGPTGEGAPPEIKSLLDPVRGASAAMIVERMKKAGRTIPMAMAQQLAKQAETEIRRRLAHGGKQMPPFEHLRGDEVDALLGYLGTLAGAPPTKARVMLVDQSAARVGEHVVKGTCHVCHDATGPGGGHMAMMRGIIPSLASFPQQLSLSAVERQVHYGSPRMMMMMGSAQMPAFPYLTEDEIAAAYFYLAAYAPTP
jgi:mono/diheme cytochrome c family protein